jgi:type I restriction-modification system DNA methylase subunit
MVDMIPDGAKQILEPTPGKGNLVWALRQFYGKYEVTAPADFFKMDHRERFDAIVMNPPYSSNQAYGMPEDLQGLKVGYWILDRCIEMSSHVIALMPWFTLTDSDVRMRKFHDFGLKSITALPRGTFGYSRIQTCILELSEGWNGKTEFIIFERMHK